MLWKILVRLCQNIICNHGNIYWVFQKFYANVTRDKKEYMGRRDVRFREKYSGFYMTSTIENIICTIVLSYMQISVVLPQ